MIKQYDIKLKIDIDRLINRNKREMNKLLYILDKKNDYDYYANINDYLKMALKMVDAKIDEVRNGKSRNL